MHRLAVALSCLVATAAMAEVPDSKRAGEATPAGMPRLGSVASTDAGQFAPNGWWLPDGGLSVNCLPAGYANSATCGTFIMNAPYARRARPGAAERGMAGVSPYMDDPVARATEPSHDQVNLYLEASAQPLGTPEAPNPGFAAFGVTFDRAARSAGLPAAVHGFALPSGHAIDPANLALLRRGMWVRTNQSPPLVGQLDRWDDKGRWFAVDSWTGQDGTLRNLDVADASAVPVTGGGASEVIVDYTTAIWAANANVFCYERGLANSCIGVEGTVNNDKPFSYNKFNPFMSAPRSWGDFWGGFRSQSFAKPGDAGPVTGADFVALGRVADGFLSFGGYNAAYNCTPNDPSAGIGMAPGFDPRQSACFKAVMEAGRFAQAESQQRGITFAISAAEGSLDLGAEGLPDRAGDFAPTSSQPAIRFHTAGGGGNPQAAITASGGAAGKEGTGILEYRAAGHEFALPVGQVTIGMVREAQGIEIRASGSDRQSVPLTVTAAGTASTTVGSAGSAAHLVPVPVSQLGACAAGDLRFASNARRPGDPAGAGRGGLAVCAPGDAGREGTRWYLVPLVPIAD